jgi:hypothetical protein
MRVNNHFTPQYIPEDNSEHHTRRRENLKSHHPLFDDPNIWQRELWMKNDLSGNVNTIVNMKMMHSSSTIMVLEGGLVLIPIHMC